MSTSDGFPTGSERKTVDVMPTPERFELWKRDVGEHLGGGERILFERDMQDAADSLRAALSVKREPKWLLACRASWGGFRWKVPPVEYDTWSAAYLAAVDFNKDRLRAKAFMPVPSSLKDWLAASPPEASGSGMQDVTSLVVPHVKHAPPEASGEQLCWYCGERLGPQYVPTDLGPCCSNDCARKLADRPVKPEPLTAALSRAYDNGKADGIALCTLQAEARRVEPEPVAWAEVERLRGALEAIAECLWRGGLDGFDVQDILEGRGILVPGEQTPEWIEEWGEDVVRYVFSWWPDAVPPSAQQEASEKWRDTMTAPKDGTSVLIAGGTYYYDGGMSNQPYPLLGVTIASWDGVAWNGEHGSEYDGEYWYKPTHWMPLPMAPREEKK